MLVLIMGCVGLTLNIISVVFLHGNIVSTHLVGNTEVKISRA